MINNDHLSQRTLVDPIDIHLFGFLGSVSQSELGRLDAMSLQKLQVDVFVQMEESNGTEGWQGSPCPMDCVSDHCSNSMDDSEWVLAR